MLTNRNPCVRTWLTSIMVYASVFTACGETLTLLSNQNAGETAFSDGSFWSVNMMGERVAPDSSLAVDYDYLIADGKVMRTPASSNGTFRGNSLTVGESADSIGKIQECSTVATTTTYVRGLRLVSGSYMRLNNRNKEGTIVGDVTVLSPIGSPFVIGSTENCPGGHLRFTGAFSGNTGVELSVQGLSSNFYVKLVGDMSGYQGKISVASGAFLLGDSELPGLVSLSSNTRFGVEQSDDTCRIGSFAIGNGVLFEVPVSGTEETNGMIVVTDTYEQSGVATIALTTLNGPLGRVPVLRLAEGCSGDLDEQNFVFGGLAPGNGKSPTFDGVCLAGRQPSLIVEKSNGVQTLYVDFGAPLVRLVKAGGSDNASASNPSVLNATAWSDGMTPHGGVHYLIGGTTAKTPMQLAYTNDYTFPGLSLLVETNASIVSVTKNLTLTNLIFRGSTAGVQWLNTYQSATGSGNNNSIRGGVMWTTTETSGDRIFFRCYFNQILEIASELKGNGNLEFSGSAGSSYPCGTYVLSGPNTNFAGTIHITMPSGTSQGKIVPSFVNYETLRFSEGRNLGGVLPDFNPKALVVDQMSKVEPTADVMLSEPTRGVYVGNMARFSVAAGRTFCLMCPLAVHGHLYKEGDGCLELGGELHFGEGGMDDLPTVGSNLLTIAGGVFRPLSSGCIDGLTLVCSNETAVALNAAPINADIKKFGIRNVKTNVPFQGTIPVSLSVQGEIGDAYRVPICTVKTEIAAMVKTQLSVRFPQYRHWISIASVDNGDGTTTLVAQCSPKGFVVSFR